MEDATLILGKIVSKVVHSLLLDGSIQPRDPGSPSNQTKIVGEWLRLGHDLSNRDNSQVLLLLLSELNGIDVS